VVVAIDFFVAVFARAMLSNFVFFEEEASVIVVYGWEATAIFVSEEEATVIVVCICHF